MRLLKKLFGRKQTRVDSSRVGFNIPVELRPLLTELDSLTHTVEIPRRVQLCRQALALLDRTDNVRLWAALQVDLGTSLRRNPQGERVQNIEEAIECYQQALTVVTQKTMPVEWAQTMTNLALAYALRIHGERAQNIEMAIAACQQALTIRTRKNMPVEWAQTMNDLAEIYDNRIYGDRAQNIEEAIATFEQALTIRTEGAMPVEWAQTKNSLALAYANRICGERAQNIEEAIAACQQALTVRTQDAMPIEWAQTTANLALAYSNRIHGERAQNIEEAITAYQDALTVFTREALPFEWARTMMNLAGPYIFRVRGERAQNIEEAITACQDALTVFTREALPFEWARTMMNLATAYASRIQGERAQNIEEAIECYKQTLSVITQEAIPVEWAQIMHNLAIAYVARISGDRAQNIEEAIACYQQVLTVMTQDAAPVDWAQTMMNLADAYKNRIHGEQAQNIEDAIATCQDALMIFTKRAMPIMWATTMMNLANAYRDRIRGEPAQNIEDAIAACQDTLTVFTQEAMPVEWARTMINLAITYYYRIQGKQAQNIEDVIAASQQVLTVITQESMPIDWAETMNILAAGYADRRHGDRGQNVEKAIACYRQALTVRTKEAMPTQHRLTQRNLGNLALAEQRWHLVADAFQSALSANELLYTIGATLEARQAELREVVGLPVAYAYALARQHEDGNHMLGEAVVTLERNRARWLAESLALRSEKPLTVPAALWQRFTEVAAQIQQLQTEAQLPDDTPGKRKFLTLSGMLATARIDLTEVIEDVRAYDADFMPVPSFGDITSAFATSDDSESEVGVYLLTTRQGGLALLVHASRVIPVWLDALTDESLRDLLRRWFEAYDGFLHQQTDDERQRWFEQVDAVTSQLWQTVMEPLVVALADLGLTHQNSEQLALVTLISTGPLALLPLHVAWTEDATTPTGRRYFLDDYAVRYAPSATALRYCRERVGDVSVEQLLALDEPKPINNGGPLPNSSREVKAISSLFSTAKVLKHEHASREATLGTLAAAQVAHFSCHGANNWQNPLDSGLLLANNQLLTVRDFLELRLPGARLATLSACETGIVGTDLPDEVIMLPSALVQAGYAGVVASLWSVADVSTAMLMVRFYQYWREEGLEPVYALRTAQRWVRDTTNQDKADYFGQFVPGLGTRMADTVAAEFFSAAMLAKEGPEARSFAHPFWWGAFYLTGV